MMRRSYLVIVILLILSLITIGCQSRNTEYEAMDKQEKQGKREAAGLNKFSHEHQHLNHQDNMDTQRSGWQPQDSKPKQTDQPNPTTNNVQTSDTGTKSKALETQKKAIKKPRVKVAGVYVSGYVAGSAKRMDQIIRLLKQTELNTVVIDIKNDSGHLTYDSKIPLASDIGADRKRYIKDLPKLITKLKQNNIYVIGRLVTFKDPYLAASRKQYAMKRKDNGARWKDRSGIVWVDPYSEEVRQYNLDIAKEATTLGIDEIQFDYVRFPDNGKKVDQVVQFQNKEGISKSDLIHRFLSEAQKQLHPLGAYLSADVFGLTTSVKDDMGIGQSWDKIASSVDYISPMVYPSHYSNGMYGIKHPDLNPYAVVKKAVKDAKAKNEAIQAPTKAIIRPWYQSFTATWVKPHKRYGKKEILAQIRAAKEQGVEEYLLWNPNCKYEMFR